MNLNMIRAEHGLAPLRLNRELTAAARSHTSEMLADGYFSHNSMDGESFWQRIERFYPSAQYRVWSVGENLLWAGRPLDAQRALAMWMASPEHRANVLGPGWRDVGIAVEYERDAPGAFGGYNAMVIAADFGARQ